MIFIEFHTVLTSSQPLCATSPVGIVSMKNLLYLEACDRSFEKQSVE